MQGGVNAGPNASPVEVRWFQVAMEGAGERCGLFAIRAKGHPAAELTFNGLLALQHRGQESAGIVSGDGVRLLWQGGMGLVRQVFDASVLVSLPGYVAVGHVRYPTGGVADEGNIQPLVGSTRSGHQFALAHNGNLLTVNGLDTFAAPECPTADTHALVAALSMRSGKVVDALRAVLPAVEGAYSIAVATESEIYAARDRFGFRPLCLGQVDPDGWVVASETAAMDSIGARFIREVSPGELVAIDANGLHAERLAVSEPRPCVFEQVYFARPDSLIGGVRVADARRAMGAALAQESPARASVVVAVPETGRAAAIGYAEASGIPYADGLVRDSRIGRTFIRSASATDRQVAIRLKLSPVPEVVMGQRVALVDDSLVRASTAKIVIGMLRSVGAAEVHLRVASPPVRWPCFFGVDISDAELPARQHTLTEIARLVGADSLGYLSLPSMTNAVGGGPVCAGCFTGEYPVRVPLAKPPESAGARLGLSRHIRLIRSVSSASGTALLHPGPAGKALRAAVRAALSPARRSHRDRIPPVR